MVMDLFLVQMFTSNCNVIRVCTKAHVLADFSFLRKKYNSQVYS